MMRSVTSLDYPGFNSSNRNEQTNLERIPSRLPLPDAVFAVCTKRHGHIFLSAEASSSAPIMHLIMRPVLGH